jgi:hypothetical protein
MQELAHPAGLTVPLQPAKRAIQDYRAQASKVGGRERDELTAEGTPQLLVPSMLPWLTLYKRVAAGDERRGGWCRERKVKVEGLCLRVSGRWVLNAASAVRQ